MTGDTARNVKYQNCKLKNSFPIPFFKIKFNYCNIAITFNSMDCYHYYFDWKYLCHLIFGCFKSFDIFSLYDFKSITVSI